MIKSIIENYLKKIIKEPVAIEVFAPEQEQFGHYSTSVALKLAKEKKQSPMEIANKIVSGVKGQPRRQRVGAPTETSEMSDIVSKIEVVPPGFINFWISPEALQDELKEILKKKEKYGRLNVKGKISKVQLEYVSANPTGPLTLANGRGGFFGDVLSNILEFSGCKIEREYYVNDTGNQIFTLGRSILALRGLIDSEEKFYKGQYLKKWAEGKSALIKRFANNPLKLGQLAAKDFLAEIKKVLNKGADICFDRWTSEDKHIHKKSFITKTMEVFNRTGLVYEKEGAVWLKTSKYGDDKDRVLITSDGLPTYFLADAGHFLETKSRGFNSKIMILGPDHYGYVKRIQAAAKIIGLEKLEIIITQAVRLIKDNQEVKMSKRKGEFVAFEELLKEVGKDIARFFFLMHSPDSHMDFDLSLAKEQSMKNPVYYLQYAAVRAQSILNKSNVKNKMSNANLNLLNTPEDINLMRLLARFPESVEESRNKYSPQILARYSLDLAREFHNFYERERIIGEAPELAVARLQLIKAVRIVFGNLFNLLDVSYPKKM